LVLLLSVVALRVIHPTSEWIVFCAVPLLGWGLGSVFFIARRLLAAWDSPRLTGRDEAKPNRTERF
jgi:hypothetical protein